MYDNNLKEAAYPYNAWELNIFDQIVSKGGFWWCPKEKLELPWNDKCLAASSV